jgi:hypothetical protein
MVPSPLLVGTVVQEHMARLAMAEVCLFLFVCEPMLIELAGQQQQYGGGGAY